MSNKKRKNNYYKTRKYRRDSVTRADGWDQIYEDMANLKDKKEALRLGNKYHLDKVMLNLMYRLDGFAKKIVNKPVDISLASGFNIENEEGNNLIKTWNELGLGKGLEKNLKLDRLYGGSITLFSVEGSGTLEEPLDLSKAKAINFHRTYDRYDVTVDLDDIDIDPESDNFLNPILYKITPRSKVANGLKDYKVHYTKCIVNDGIFTPPEVKRLIHNDLWGDSVLQCLFDALNNLKNSYIASNKMLSSAIQTIMQIKNLQQMLMKGKNSGIKERLQAIQDGIDIDNIILMDIDEKFEKISANFSGTKDVIEQNAISLAAQADFPVTLLLGSSPAGENATGEYDKKNEIKFIQGYQKEKVFNPIKYINQLIFACKDYGVKIKGNEEPKFKWNPVETILAKEFSEIYKNTSEGDENYYNMGGTLTRDEIRDSRFKKDQFSQETDTNPEYDNKIIPEDEVL